MSSSSIRANVLAVRDKLDDGRAHLRAQHDRGSAGIQLCALLTDLIDGVVLDLYEAALADMGETETGGLSRQVALVAHGGYGRRDLAPFSDVDLTLLHTRPAASRARTLAARLVADFHDAGIPPGPTYRTPEDASKFALQDPKTFTSLAEARFLAGSVQVFTKFARRIRRDARWGYRKLYSAIDSARREERIRYGETVYLLHPNVKKSRGGLRDIQLLRWIGFARFGECEPHNLYRAGHLSDRDRQVMRTAYEFLLRVRNEMHFHAGRAQDVLDRAEQIRIAETFGYQGDDNILAVEQFMSEYFEQTREVRDVVAHFMASYRPRNPLLAVLEPLLSHSMERDYRVGPVHIGATRRSRDKLSGDLVEVLRLMDLANMSGKRISHRTWVTIRETMADRDEVEVTPDAAQRFVSLLSQTARLGNLLRRLHELRVLEKIVPGMGQARSLLQFNQYHKYTVDEHCIRTVERAAEFRHREDTLGRAYRKIIRKDLLHLAALLHDLGKGRQEDHSEVGRRLAVETAERLNLSEESQHTLEFLVHRHLLMSDEAFQRAGTEEEVVRFAVEVRSPEWLRMLFVLTCADLAAVGPGVLNDWKIDVLSNLYRRARDYLTGGAPEEEQAARLRRRRDEIFSAVPAGDERDWFVSQVELLPPAYLYRGEPARIVEELARLRQLPASGVASWGRYLDESGVVEYSVGASESRVSDVFHKLTGALTTEGLEILSAEIHTLADGLVLDRFYVRDFDFAGEPPPERFGAVCSRLETALTSDAPPAFRRTWSGDAPSSTDMAGGPTTRITFDNDSSETYTIVRVFTRNHRGLLYGIGRALWEAGLSVAIARIGTYGEQVVDVFYVTDQRGRKITHGDEQLTVHARVEAAIKQVQDEEPALPA